VRSFVAIGDEGLVSCLVRGSKFWFIGQSLLQLGHQATCLKG
jgi:hypothetical protein